MITDEALRAALEEVDDAILASLPDPSACEHQFSARFEKRIQKVRRRARHPIAYKALRQAACFLLAILILFSSIMVFSAEARAAVVDWIKEQFETFYHYFFAGETSSETDERSEYELGWVPDGYMLVNSQAVENRVTLIYLNNDGLLIQFSYLYGDSSAPMFADKDNYTKLNAYVCNMPADIYLSQISTSSNGIVWTEPSGDVLFCISAFADESELIKLAESVLEKNK